MRELVANLLDDGSPSFDELFAAARVHLPIVDEWEHTPQDATWHAEGDVYIHTRMVVERCYELLDSGRFEFGAQERAALVLGALLHDVAKPRCTREREIDGRLRIVAPRHELDGRSMLATRLAGQVPHDLLWMVMSLTGYHNIPKLLVVRDAEPGRYRSLSRKAPMHLLRWLEEADILGRECEDKELQLEILSYFELSSTELGVWTGPNDDDWSMQLRDKLAEQGAAFVDLALAKARAEWDEGLISTPDEALARSYRLRDGFAQVVMMVGMPGSGKSTLVRKHFEDHELISLDEIRDELGRRADQGKNAQALRMATERLKEALRKKRKVVWDATSLRRDFRQKIAQLCEDYGALLTCVVMSPPLATLDERNRKRQHPVPVAVRTRQLDSFQWPEVDEAHRMLVLDERGAVSLAVGFTEEEPYGLARGGET